jgi:hypothetical protein
MTDDKDRKKLSDEEMEDVAGGTGNQSDGLRYLDMPGAVKKKDGDGKLSDEERKAPRG